MPILVEAIEVYWRFCQVAMGFTLVAILLLVVPAVIGATFFKPLSEEELKKLEELRKERESPELNALGALAGAVLGVVLVVYIVTGFK